MGKTHQHLLKKFVFYKKWHEFSYHTNFHWIVFFVVALVFSSTVLTATGFYLTDEKISTNFDISDKNVFLNNRNKSIFPRNELIVKLKAGPTLSMIQSGLSSEGIASPSTQSVVHALIDNQKEINISRTEQVFRNYEKVGLEKSTKQKMMEDSLVKKGVYLDRIFKFSFDRELSEQEFENVRASLARNIEVEYVQPNYAVKIQMVPNDSYFNSSGSWGQPYDDLWALKKINADTAWDITEGANITVGVVDTGVDYLHSDLASNIWINSGEIPNNNIDDDMNGYVDDVRGWDFANSDADPVDDFGHGTHVAGTIAAVGNNASGIIGVAPQAKVMAVKGLDSNGSGFTSNLAQGIVYAALNGASVINNSWGCYGPCPSNPLAEEAVITADALGSLVVFAAGNTSNDVANYSPQNMINPKPLVVSATTEQDTQTHFTNYGILVDVAAPGGGTSVSPPSFDPFRNILSLKSSICNPLMCNSSLVVDNIYMRQAGTSMAAPHASGVATLIRSLNPQFSNDDIRNVLKMTSVPVSTTDYLGQGRINASNAVLVTMTPPMVKLNTFPNPIGGLSNIKGTATGGNFFQYTLSYGVGVNPNSWTQFHSSSEQINNGVLYSNFDTTLIPDDIYTFKLVVETTDHFFIESQQIVRIENIVITAPLNNDILRSGDVFAVTGMVRGPLLSYKIEHGIGRNPSQWSSAGVTLANNGTQQVINGTLGTLDTSVLPADDFFSVRLTVTRDSNIMIEYSYMIYIDSKLKQGWPQYIPGHSSIMMNFETDGYEDQQDVKVVDIDGDGSMEIATIDAGNFPQGIYSFLNVYRNDGSLWWTKKLGLAIGGEYLVVGDLNNDGRMEIFADADTNTIPIQYKLFGFDYLGNNLPGWPVSLVKGRRLAKVIADIDQDGFNEIIVKSYFPNFGDSLWTINLSGLVQQIASFPPCGNGGGRDESVPSVGNFDDDTDLEIVTKYGCKEVAVYNRDGSLLPGWPQEMNGITMRGSPVIGDLDNDGQEDIVVTVGADSNPYADSGIYVFDRNGNVMPGWPYMVSPYGFNAQTPALADIDGDGNLEIAIPSFWTKQQYVLNYKGIAVQGWPKPIPPYFWNYQYHNSPTSNVIGDIDGDNSLDIILVSGGIAPDTVVNGGLLYSTGLLAWKSDGAPIDLNPNSQTVALLMEGGTFYEHARNNTWIYPKATPVLTDIDSNGKLDIVASTVWDVGWSPVATEDFEVDKKRNSIYVWELDVPYVPENIPWPMFKRDVQQSGRYGISSVSNNLPPNLPSSLSQSSGLEGSITAMKTPSFTFTISDPDQGQAIGYQIQISSDKDFMNISDDYTWSGSTVNPKIVTYTSVNSLASGTYWWRVRGTDAQGAFSDWVYFGSQAVADFTIVSYLNHFDLPSDITSWIPYASGGSWSVLNSQLQSPNNTKTSAIRGTDTLPLSDFDATYTTKFVSTAKAAEGGFIFHLQNNGSGYLLKIDPADKRWRLLSIDGLGKTTMIQEGTLTKIINYGVNYNINITVLQNKLSFTINPPTGAGQSFTDITVPLKFSSGRFGFFAEGGRVVFDELVIK